MANPIHELAKRLSRVEKNVRALGSSSQLAYSSLEDGAITAFDADGIQRQLIGRQWDGTYVATSSNGPVPPTPTNPAVTDGTESVVIRWLGDFVGGAVLPMDFLRVDVHIGATSGFTPEHSNRVGTITAPTGGEVTVGLTPGTYWFKLVCWTQAGAVSLSSGAVEGDSWPVEVSSDGFAPASSPSLAPPGAVRGGLEIISVRWDAIVNADPVRYDVHISAVDGFTPDSTTLAGTTSATAFTIRALPGTAPSDPNDPDPTELQFETDYFVKIIAHDADGSAAPGVQGSAQVFKLTGVHLSADSVTAAHVLAGTLTGDLFSASVIISGAFRTAEAGQRVEMTPLGFFAYKADGSIMLRIPTDSEDAFFDGELVVRGATILGGMSIQSSQNELTADAALTLMRGIVAPTTTPQFQITYDTVQPSTTSLSSAQKTNNDPTFGLGGPFDLIASEVTCVEWRTGDGGYFVFHQIRPNGTRSWNFNADGTPKTILGQYFSDLKDWEFWSAFEMTTSTAPKNGRYVMFRYMDGAGTDYYLSSPFGLNRYSRQNGVAAPAIGNNGTDVFVAEIVNTDDLRVRYFLPDGLGGNLTAPTATYESTTGYSATIGMCNVTYSTTGFDIGTARYLTAQRNNGTVARLLNVSGSNLYPGGSGNNWASANKEAESFEPPTSQRRAMVWDGTQFWTYAADGLLYKHTAERWDPAVTSSQLWGQVTLRDDDAAGTGTHETTPGAAKAFTHKRRAKFIWTPPSVPDNGGVDDPNEAWLYMGRGSTQPANSAMYKQAESATPTLPPVTITTLTTATANPPTVNSFPASNAALIRNDNDELQIKGDGSILGKTIAAPSIRIGATYAGGDEVAIRGPRWYGYVSGTANLTTGSNSLITAWVADGTGNSGEITLSAGVFTVTRAGMYKVKCQVTIPVGAGPRRFLQIYEGSASSTVLIGNSQNGDFDVNATAGTTLYVSKTIPLTAGQQFRATAFQDSGGTLACTPGSGWTFIQIEYVGP